MARDSFEDCYIEMQVAVNFAAESLACWEVVSHDQVRNWKGKGWEHIPALQSYLNRASFLTFVIQSYKVLDRHGDAYSLYELVKYAEIEDIISKPQEWVDIIETDLKPIWEKIKLLRHKFYAHLDKKKSPKQVLLETGVNSADFRTLLDGYESFLVKLAGRLGQKLTPLATKEELVKTDIATVLDALKAQGFANR